MAAQTQAVQHLRRAVRRAPAVLRWQSLPLVRAPPAHVAGPMRHLPSGSLPAARQCLSTPPAVQPAFTTLPSGSTASERSSGRPSGTAPSMCSSSGGWRHTLHTWLCQALWHSRMTCDTRVGVWPCSRQGRACTGPPAALQSSTAPSRCAPGARPKAGLRASPAPAARRSEKCSSPVLRAAALCSGRFQASAKGWTGRRGTTLGIVGYGSIGQACRQLAQAYGMRVIALRRSVHQSEPQAGLQASHCSCSDGAHAGRLPPQVGHDADRSARLACPQTSRQAASGHASDVLSARLWYQRGA